MDTTVNCCLILLALVFGGALFSWFNPGTTVSAVGGKLMMFSILGLVMVVATYMKSEWAGVTAPLYAICEGLVLGCVSRLAEMWYPGIVFQAILLTFGVAFGMLALYKAKIIKVNDRYMMLVGSAVFGICALYLVNFIMSFFGSGIPFLHSSGVFGIVFSVFVVVVAALCLGTDFELIRQISNRGLPKHMAWVAALGLMVTLIWLYLEILNLLIKLRDR
jgi:uncharacterized YccA/Bax inhibitor family protein